MISAAPARLAFVALLAAAGLPAGHSAAFGQGAANSVNLAPHIAIYDLTLKSSRGKRALESVRGRIVYDFSGSSCEGYALQFRQVTELDQETVGADRRSKRPAVAMHVRDDPQRRPVRDQAASLRTVAR